MLRNGKDATTPMPDKVPDSAAALITLTYSATTDPSLYTALLESWEHYMERVGDLENSRAAAEYQEHFNRAFEILTRIGRQKAQTDRQDEVLDALGPKAGLVDDQGRTISSGAQMPSVDGDVLRQALQRIRAGGGVEVLPIHDDEAGLHDCAVIAPLDDRDGQRKVFVVAACGDAAGVGAEGRSALARQFGFSPAETEVLSSLLQGARVEEIARRRNTSLATTRSQVRQLLEKTGTRSMTDLLRHCLQISGQMRAMKLATRIGSGTSRVHERMDRIVTPDGRTLAWRTFGDPEGRPVVFLHNMIGGPFLTPRMEAALAERGWFVVGPSRPGFGLSDSIAATGPALLRQTCTDLRFLLDQLRVADALLLAPMSSAGLAARFGRDHADRTRAVLTTGHAGLMDDRMIDAMAMPARVMARTYRRSPVALRFLVRVAVASVDMLGAERNVRNNLQGSASDRRLLDDPEVIAALARGVRHAVAQGGEAFSRDGFVALYHWEDAFRALSCPALCILGEHDHNYPPDQVRRLMADLPDYHLDVVSGAGHFAMWSHFDHVLDRMDQLWQRRIA